MSGGALPAEKIVASAAKDARSSDLAPVEDAIAMAKDLTAAIRDTYKQPESQGPKQLEPQEAKQLEPQEAKQLKPQGAKQRNLIRFSILLAVVALVMWWYCRGEALLVVWRLSYPLCFMLSMWTYFLGKSKAAYFVLQIFTGLLLGHFADTVLSPSIGVLVIQCNTHYAACLMGYALAEHRQHEGTDMSAYRISDIGKEEEARLRPLRTHVVITVPVLLLAPVAIVVWLLWHSADYPMEFLVGMVSLTLSMISLFGILFTAMHLRGGPICPTVFSIISSCVFAIVFAHMVLYEIFGAASAICGYSGLGVAALFGYYLCVFDTFKEIKREREASEVQSKRN